MSRRYHAILVFIIVMMIAVTPQDVGANNMNKIGGKYLPNNATKYYDSDGRLMGAKVEESNAPNIIYPQNPFDSSKNLPKVEFKRGESGGIIINFIDDDKVVDAKYYSLEEIASYVGSIEKAEELIQNSIESDTFDSNPTITPVSQMSEGDSANPMFNSNNQVVPTGPWGYWRLDTSWITPQVYTKIGVMYSEYRLETTLHLKMSCGTKVTTRIGAAGFTYGNDVLFDKTSLTHFFIRYAYNRDVEYQYDIKYEHWTFMWNYIIPTTTKEFWYPSQFRSLSGRYGSYIPSDTRTKTISDDTLVLSGYETKEYSYNKIDVTSFGFAVGAKLKQKWYHDLVETEVPLASVSYLGSMWTSSEAVYEFYNPTSSTHVWEVYEWGATTGTDPGWGISYDTTS